eukprot:4000290-Prymnesium_polylepis.1
MRVAGQRLHPRGSARAPAQLSWPPPPPLPWLQPPAPVPQYAARTLPSRRPRPCQGPPCGRVIHDARGHASRAVPGW